jgi:peptidoglycan/LPS O-acetylase OafA/YrhL
MSSYPSSSPAGSEQGRAAVGRWLFLGGGIAATVSPFLPWVSSNYLDGGSLWHNATYNDDTGGLVFLLLLCGTAALGALLRFNRTIDVKIGRIWGGVTGAMALLLAFGLYSTISDRSREGPGFGFYVLLLAAFAILVGPFLEW